jgi:hypothetical protein
MIIFPIAARHFCPIISFFRHGKRQTSLNLLSGEVSMERLVMATPSADARQVAAVALTTAAVE